MCLSLRQRRPGDEPGELATTLGLHRLCASLGSQLLAGSSSNGMRVATLRLHAHGADIPPGAKVRHDTRGFRIFGDTEGSYVSDGASTLSIHGERSEADAYLDESFHQKPRFLQWQFWSFCILTLLRPLGTLVSTPLRSCRPRKQDC